ncbi:MAG: hypothetical protein IIA72_05485 [Proteobacteria bacterium]|nr:hypothetical protein [Pseudomonadota bacterium]
MTMGELAAFLEGDRPARAQRLSLCPVRILAAWINIFHSRATPLVYDLVAMVQAFGCDFEFDTGVYCKKPRWAADFTALL